MLQNYVYGIVYFDIMILETKKKWNEIEFVSIARLNALDHSYTKELSRLSPSEDHRTRGTIISHRLVILFSFLFNRTAHWTDKAIVDKEERYTGAERYGKKENKEH